MKVKCLWGKLLKWLDTRTNAICMGRIDVNLPDDLEKELRKKMVERFGGRRGDLTRAVTEAVELWIDEGEEKSSSE